ncbi:MAG: FAD-dependent oxidoreductase [Longimicrobiales bacterium]
MADTIVVGGGLAGCEAAWQLAVCAGTRRHEESNSNDQRNA